MSGDTPIPNGWRLVSLSDLGEVNRGRSRHRPRDAAHLYGGPYPFVQTGDVKASGGRITSFKQTYSDAGLAQSRLWPKETMCITIAANIAETGILQFPGCFPDSVIGFVADDKKCNVYFIEYVFRLLRKKLQAEASGSVQDNINLQTLERLKFPIPELEQQVELAKVLCAIDNKIELNQKINQTLEQIAQTLFKSWFVDFEPVKAKQQLRELGGNDQQTERAAQAIIAGAINLKDITKATDLTKIDQQLKQALQKKQAKQTQKQKTQLTTTASHFPDRLVESELGLMPEGWDVRNLDEIAKFLNGVAAQKYPSREGKPSMPVIKISEIRGGISAKTSRASAGVNSKYIVENGDLLFSWSGSLLVQQWHLGSGLLNQHIFKVTSQDFPKWFYYQWIKHHLKQFQGIAADKAVTMGHIKRGHLAEAQVTVPSRELLESGTTLFGVMLEQELQNFLQSEQLAALRDQLLQKLLSGEVKIAER
ncbi:MAG: restriction endonuclease subunit S [Halothiobacillus sp.]|jgi:type I restriction enzyme S subunit|nr:restriction endonuclease subunit S [Halothiobacillus sp.]